MTRAEPIRLDLNESPFAPPAGAVASIRAAAARVGAYPIDTARRAHDAVAAHYGVRPEQVLLTSGVDEATDLCLLELGDLHTFTPGFDGYAARARALGRRVVETRLAAGFAIPSELNGDRRGDVVVAVASPNNPTANQFPDAAIERLCTRFAHVLLDETYVDFAPRAPGIGLLARFPRLVVFRSFSKSFALAGLRLGVLLAGAELVARLRARQQFHSVDRLALEGLLGALEHGADYVRDSSRRLARLRDELVAELRDLGVFAGVHDSHANFVLVSCHDAAEVERVRSRLRAAGVLVASCRRLGLPEGLRIAVPTRAGREALLAALRTAFGRAP